MQKAHPFLDWCGEQPSEKHFGDVLDGQQRFRCGFSNHLCCHGRIESFGRFAKDGEVADRRTENRVDLDVCQSATV
jgi:hypothetical protein